KSIVPARSSFSHCMSESCIDASPSANGAAVFGWEEVLPDGFSAGTAGSAGAGSDAGLGVVETTGVSGSDTGVATWADVASGDAESIRNNARITCSLAGHVAFGLFISSPPSLIG